MAKIWIYVAVLVAFFFPNLKAEQLPLQEETSSPFTTAFDELVDKLLEEWHVPGIAIAVVDDEETFSKGYGIATFPSEEVTPHTLFYPASTTKSFTSAAVSLIIDDTANSSSPWTWTTPMSSIIRDDFVMSDDYYTHHITLEDALSHRTGLTSHDATIGGPNFTSRDAVRNLRHLPLTAEIRTKWQYNNVMFIAVSHAIESFTGMWLGSFLRERIWKPLGMSSTFFSLSDALEGAKVQNISIAHGYEWDRNAGSYIVSPWVPKPIYSGAGAIISNVVDYAKWIRCHMEQLPPLSQAAYDSFLQPRAIVNPGQDTPFSGPTLYSLGWFIDNYHGETILSHEGGHPGFGALMSYLPEHHWGIVMMANTATTSNVIQRILSFELIDKMLAVSEVKRIDWGAAFKKQMDAIDRLLEDPVGLMYPTAPRGKERIPLSLSLESYAGLYTHPAYPAYNFTVHKKTKRPTEYPADDKYEQNREVLLHQTGGRMNAIVKLEHVSGEYFMRYHGLDMAFNWETGEFLPGQWMVGKAEFKLGEDGTVRQMGMLMDVEAHSDKIWFTKQQ